jgi:hypothetical protein
VGVLGPGLSEYHATVVADRYDILVDAEFAAESRRILAALPTAVQSSQPRRATRLASISWQVLFREQHHALVPRRWRTGSMSPLTSKKFWDVKLGWRLATGYASPDVGRLATSCAGSPPGVPTANVAP